MIDNETQLVDTDGLAAYHEALMNAIANGDGASIKTSCDWAVDDPNADGYIANRPFYDVDTVTKIFTGTYQSYTIPEHPLWIFDSRTDGSESYFPMDDLLYASESLVAGDRYIVKIGNSATECIAGVRSYQIRGTQDQQSYLTGPMLETENVKLVNESGLGLQAWCKSNGPGSVLPSLSVEITHLGVDYVKIPAVYLPEATTASIGAVKIDGYSITKDSNGEIHAVNGDWNVSNTKSGTYIKNRPFYAESLISTTIATYTDTFSTSVLSSESVYTLVNNDKYYQGSGELVLKKDLVSGTEYAVEIDDEYVGLFSASQTTYQTYIDEQNQNDPIMSVTIVTPSVVLVLTKSTRTSLLTAWWRADGDIDEQIGGHKVIVYLVTKLPRMYLDIPEASSSIPGTIKYDGVTIDKNDSDQLEVVVDNDPPTPNEMRPISSNAVYQALAALTQRVADLENAINPTRASVVDNSLVLEGNSISVNNGDLSIESNSVSVTNNDLNFG